MRSQYCRMHIDKAAEECGIESRYVQEVKDAANFAEKHCSMLQCSTRAIHAVIKVQDQEIQAAAILHIEKAQNRKTPQGGNYQSEPFTEKQVREFITRAEKEVNEARLKEQKRIEAEARKAAEESAQAHKDAVPLPPVPKIYVEVVEVAPKGESAATEVGASNNPVVALDENHIEPKNSLSESYGQKVVGTVIMPANIPAAALTRTAEEIATLIATANDAIQQFIEKDKNVLIERHKVKEEEQALLEQCKPLEEQLKELNRKISERKARMKGLDRERQTIGLNIQDQHARILKLKNELDEVIRK